MLAAHWRVEGDPLVSGADLEGELGITWDGGRERLLQERPGVDPAWGVSL